jgi:prepilin-type N-terminal cleavage/methylation domain-containing protein
MLRSKNHNGFTLIEALLATVVMGLLLSPMIITESSIFQRVVRLSQQFERFFQAQDFLYQTRRSVPKDARQFKIEKKVTKPTTTLRYELMEPQGDSTLTSVRNILLERVSWEWTEGKNKRTESMVTLIYKPKGKEK